MFHWADSAAPFAMSARVFLFKNPWIKPPSSLGHPAWRAGEFLLCFLVSRELSCPVGILDGFYVKEQSKHVPC